MLLLLLLIHVPSLSLFVAVVCLFVWLCGAAVSEDLVEQRRVLQDIADTLQSLQEKQPERGESRTLQVLVQGLEELQQTSERVTEDIRKRAAESRRRLVKSVEPQLFPEKGRVCAFLRRACSFFRRACSFFWVVRWCCIVCAQSTLEKRMARDKEELLARHRAELEQLEELHRQERENFEKDVPASKRYAAEEYDRIVEVWRVCLSFFPFSSP